MKSQRLGKDISKAEILNVSAQGIWLYASGKEYFLPYDDHPWFKDAKVSEIYDFEFLHGQHLYWPELDVDLELKSLEWPEGYPLVSEN